MRTKPRQAMDDDAASHLVEIAFHPIAVGETPAAAWMRTPVLRLRAPIGTTLIEPVCEAVREGRLQLAWRCGQGTCGSCVVWLREPGQPRPLPLTRKEAAVLTRLRLLPPGGPLEQTSTPDLPRLACHLHVAQDCQVGYCAV